MKFRPEHGEDVGANQVLEAFLAMGPLERLNAASTDDGGDARREIWHPRLQRLHQYWRAIHLTDGERQHFDPTDACANWPKSKPSASDVSVSVREAWAPIVPFNAPSGSPAWS
jgi:hypothetical protein